MWVWRCVLCVSLVWSLALDSNTIRSSKEDHHELPDRSHGDPTETNANSHRRQTPVCSAADCSAPPKSGCSNKAQRRSSSSRSADRQRDRETDRQRDRETDRQRDTDGFNRTRAPEMSLCVRSGDCSAGLCCVRYLTGRRCQRVPVEGEACLLRGATKLRRNLGRCGCDAGLTCAAAGRPEPGRNTGQGVCVARPEPGRRNTRHSGKKRRTPEERC